MRLFGLELAVQGLRSGGSRAGGGGGRGACESSQRRYAGPTAPGCMLLLYAATISPTWMAVLPSGGAASGTDVVRMLLLPYAMPSTDLGYGAKDRGGAPAPGEGCGG
eukprot:1516665-Rhodomonas_salina.2